MEQKPDIKTLMDQLQTAVTEGLLKRINSDEATGAEFSAAINLLKNNNINVDVKTDNSLNELQKRIDERKKRFKITDEDRQNIVSFPGTGESNG